MTLPTILLALATLLFALIAILISVEEERHRRLFIQKQDQTHRIVHELRAPLTAIKDAAELITKDKKIKKEQEEQMLAMIEQESKKLLEQVSTILDAAKAELGKLTIEKNENDLKLLIQKEVQMFAPQAKRKNIEIATTVDPTLPLFSFDRIRIEQVMNNLLSNSLKFTNENGKITVSAAFDSELKKVTVSVSDTGIGIPKEKQSELFVKFAQAPSSEQQNGSGLGLYIVKEIVQGHGGTTQLISAPGKGTTISFTLPV